MVLSGTAYNPSPSISKNPDLLIVSSITQIVHNFSTLIRLTIKESVVEGSLYFKNVYQLDHFTHRHTHTTKNKNVVLKRLRVSHVLLFMSVEEIESPQDVRGQLQFGVGWLQQLSRVAL